MVVLFFSLRNKLFDIATLNDYTKRFLDEIYEVKKLKKSWENRYKKFTNGFVERKKFKLKNIDDQKVYSLIHNPLTISEEISELGMKCEGVYFYHFHSLPPVFENFDQLYFRKTSWEIENPKDWRGYFLASAFVIDCKKI